MTLEQKLRDAGVKLRRTSKTNQAARRAAYEVIAEARTAGYSLGAIAGMVGLTKSRIAQLCAKR